MKKLSQGVSGTYSTPTPTILAVGVFTGTYLMETKSQGAKSILSHHKDQSIAPSATDNVVEPTIVQFLNISKSNDVQDQGLLFKFIAYDLRVQCIGIRVLASSSLSQVQAHQYVDNHLVALFDTVQFVLLEVIKESQVSVSASTLQAALGSVGVQVLVHFSCVASNAVITTSSEVLLPSVSVQDIVTARAVFVLQPTQSHIVNVYEFQTQGAVSSFT